MILINFFRENSFGYISDLLVDLNIYIVDAMCLFISNKFRRMTKKHVIPIDTQKLWLYRFFVEIWKILKELKLSKHHPIELLTCTTRSIDPTIL